MKQLKASQMDMQACPFGLFVACGNKTEKGKGGFYE